MSRWLGVSVIVLGLFLPAPHAGGDRARYRADGFSPAQVALIEWALGLYAEAGLELPHLDFELHPDGEACHGGRGYYMGDGSTIRICIPDTGAVAQPVYLHEIAHAWDARTLSDDRRATFLDQRGLHKWWDDGSAPWYTFGAEQAAQIVMWGLIDRPISVATIPDSGCAELQAGYHLLTGRRPRHGFTDLCDATLQIRG